MNRRRPIDRQRPLGLRRGNGHFEQQAFGAAAKDESAGILHHHHPPRAASEHPDPGLLGGIALTPLFHSHGLLQKMAAVEVSEIPATPHRLHSCFPHSCLRDRILPNAPRRLCESMHPGLSYYFGTATPRNVIIRVKRQNVCFLHMDSRPCLGLRRESAR